MTKDEIIDLLKKSGLVNLDFVYEDNDFEIFAMYATFAMLVAVKATASVQATIDSLISEVEDWKGAHDSQVDSRNEYQAAADALAMENKKLRDAVERSARGI